MADRISALASYQSADAPLAMPTVVTRAREGRRLKPRGALGLVSAGLAGLWAVVSIGANTPAPATPDLPHTTSYTLAQRPVAPAARPAFLEQAVRATPVDVAPRPAPQVPPRTPAAVRPAVLHSSSDASHKPRVGLIVALSHKTQLPFVAGKPQARAITLPKLHGVGFAGMPAAVDV